MVPKLYNNNKARHILTEYAFFLTYWSIVSFRFPAVLDMGRTLQDLVRLVYPFFHPPPGSESSRPSL